MDVVGGLQIQAIIHLAGHRAVEVFFHVAVGHAGATGQAQCDLEGLGGQVLGRAHPVGQAQAQGLVGADPVRQKVQLARLGRSHQLGEKVAAAVVTRKPHPRKRGGEDGAAGHDAQITGQRE